MGGGIHPLRGRPETRAVPGLAQATPRNFRPRSKQPRTALCLQVQGQFCKAPRCWVAEGDSGVSGGEPRCLPAAATPTGAGRGWGGRRQGGQAV